MNTPFLLNIKEDIILTEFKFEVDTLFSKKTKLSWIKEFNDVTSTNMKDKIYIIEEVSETSPSNV